MPGVTVLAKGTTVATVTDIGGNHLITVPKGKGVLFFSLMGMKTHEEKIKGRTIINVVLEQSEVQICDVVVTGLGSKRQNDRGKVKENYAPIYSYYQPVENDFRPNIDEYDNINETEYKNVVENLLSTFSIDVDNASYSIVRQYLKGNQMPLSELRK